MAGFSDDDLREAAAEAGISPAELRTALAERDGVGGRSTAVAKREQSTPARLDAAIGLPPGDALAAVRASIERQSGFRGHLQGEAQADIVDDARGLTWRVHSRSDEGGGALVEVAIDRSAGTSAQKLATAGLVGISGAVVAVGARPGALTLIIGGFAIAGIGGFVLMRNFVQLMQASRTAESIAAQALVEAEDRGAPRA